VLSHTDSLERVLDRGKGRGENPRVSSGQAGRDGTVGAPLAPRGVLGRISVPASKSLTQRALLAAALAGEGSVVRGPLDAEDPRLLAAALGRLGFRLEWRDDAIAAHGRDAVAAAELDLGNNGTGARLLLAQLAALPGEWRLDGSPRLRERPISGLLAALRSLGAGIGGDALPLVVTGRPLRGGAVALDASASSQFVSALLLLAPRLPGGLAVELTAAPPSRPYIGLTLEVLRAFGGAVEMRDDGRRFRAVGPLRPAVFTVEGDWSAAAFPCAAAAVAGGEVTVAGVRLDSAQGDAVIARLLADAGCGVREAPDGIAISGPATRPLHADLADTPDLFPALAVVVALAGGRLTGLAGLAAKESDRLAVMVDRLRALGLTVAAEGESYSSPGGRATGRAPAGALDPADDHRVAMALAVAGTVVPGVRVATPECVGKSWPDFWRDWQALVRGGR
jgi:3-phosphoshikimate 1-carboxyvinyltransferase